MDADASEPRPGRAQPMGQQRSTTSQAALRLSRPGLTAACGSRILGSVRHSYVRLYGRAPTGDHASASSQPNPHIKKTSTHPSEATLPLLHSCPGELGDIAPRGGWG